MNPNRIPSPAVHPKSLGATLARSVLNDPTLPRDVHNLARTVLALSGDHDDVMRAHEIRTAEAVDTPDFQGRFGRLRDPNEMDGESYAVMVFATVVAGLGLAALVIVLLGHIGWVL
jgi:hypothetical protein